MFASSQVGYLHSSLLRLKLLQLTLLIITHEMFLNGGFQWK